MVEDPPQSQPGMSPEQFISEIIRGSNAGLAAARERVQPSARPPAPVPSLFATTGLPASSALETSALNPFGSPSSFTSVAPFSLQAQALPTIDAAMGFNPQEPSPHRMQPGQMALFQGVIPGTAASGSASFSAPASSSVAHAEPAVVPKKKVGRKPKASSNSAGSSAVASVSVPVVSSGILTRKQAAKAAAAASESPLTDPPVSFEDFSPQP